MLAFSQVEDHFRFRHGAVGRASSSNVDATGVPPPATAQRERKHSHDQQHNLQEFLPSLSRAIRQHPEARKAIEREIHRNARLLEEPRPTTTPGKAGGNDGTPRK